MPGLAIAACTIFTDFSSIVAATTAGPKRIAHASNAALPTGRYAELVEVRAGWKSCELATPAATWRDHLD